MVERKYFANGFEYLEVKNSVVEAKIALQGAHLFGCSIANQELLWLSQTSSFEKGVAIRGGVPLCWPAFGINNPDLAQHGFARLQMFELVAVEELREDATRIVLRLQENQETLGMWEYHFTLELEILFSDTLHMRLRTTNNDTKPMGLTQALHTYFVVSDISDVTIEGLEDKPYLNALTQERLVQKGIISFSEEFDNVYQEVDTKITLKEKNKRVEIQNTGSRSVVVWNPWREKAGRMSGMRADAYKEFVCIESANALDDFIVLEPNESHTLGAQITIATL
jgi:glucose-6-phosphate 1-epimerase